MQCEPLKKSLVACRILISPVKADFDANRYNSLKYKKIQKYKEYINAETKKGRENPTNIKGFKVNYSKKR